MYSMYLVLVDTGAQSMLIYSDPDHSYRTYCMNKDWRAFYIMVPRPREYHTLTSMPIWHLLFPSSEYILGMDILTPSMTGAQLRITGIIVVENSLGKTAVRGHSHHALLTLPQVIWEVRAKQYCLPGGHETGKIRVIHPAKNPSVRPLQKPNRLWQTTKVSPWCWQSGPIWLQP